MNPDVIKAKLESLARCLERIREKTPADAAHFLTNVDAQDLVMKNLERAVQVCVDIANHLAAGDAAPPAASMASAFLLLGRKGVLSGDLAQRMAKTVGLRNLAVHEYESLDYERIFATVSDGLGVFEDFARAIRISLKQETYPNTKKEHPHV